MKTININLIDDQTRESNKSKIAILTDDSDLNPKVKFVAVVMVISVCIVFATSFGIWFISNTMLEKTGKELADLKTEHERVNLELSKSSHVHKSLLQDKKILEKKLLAQKLISTSMLPWHKILIDISRAVPKTIKIDEISKNTETNNAIQQEVLTIKGQVPSGASKNDSLKLISFFILNINENAPVDSTLEKATIRKFDFDEKANIYNFEIASTLKALDNNQEN